MGGEILFPPCLTCPLDYLSKCINGTQVFKFGINGTALTRCRSYLNCTSQHVLVWKSMSDPRPICGGVPQVWAWDLWYSAYAQCLLKTFFVMSYSIWKRPTAYPMWCRSDSDRYNKRMWARDPPVHEDKYVGLEWPQDWYEESFVLNSVVKDLPSVWSSCWWRKYIS